MKKARKTVKGNKKGKGLAGMTVSKQKIQTNLMDADGNLINITNMDYFKPVADKKPIKIRIYPYIVTDKNHPDKVKKGELWVKRPLIVHYRVGVEEKKVLCRKLMRNEPCPVCDYARQTGVLKEFKPKKRDIYFVRTFNGTSPTSPIMLWEVSDYVFTRRLKEEIEVNPKYGSFADIESGFDLNIRFIDENAGSFAFRDVSRIDFIPRKKSIESDVLRLPKIDNKLVYHSYKEIKELLGETSEYMEDEDDEIDYDQDFEEPDDFDDDLEEEDDDLEEEKEDDDEDEDDDQDIDDLDDLDDFDDSHIPF